MGKGNLHRIIDGIFKGRERKNRRGKKKIMIWDGLIKAVIVLVPTYITAYLTDKMVYVIPMLAATSFIAVSLTSSPNTERRVEEDGYKGKDDG
jgi:hypothetical protein